MYVWNTTRSWFTGKILTYVHHEEESHGVCLFFPAFCCVYSTYLSWSPIKGQGSLIIWPMKVTHGQMTHLHQCIPLKKPLNMCRKDLKKQQWTRVSLFKCRNAVARDAFSLHRLTILLATREFCRFETFLAMTEKSSCGRVYTAFPHHALNIVFFSFSSW